MSRFGSVVLLSNRVRFPEVNLPLFLVVLSVVLFKGDVSGLPSSPPTVALPRPNLPQNIPRASIPTHAVTFMWYCVPGSAYHRCLPSPSVLYPRSNSYVTRGVLRRYNCVRTRPRMVFCESFKNTSKILYGVLKVPKDVDFFLLQ